MVGDDDGVGEQLPQRRPVAGPKDLATADFDNGRPLAVSLDCTMYGLVRTSHPASTVTTVGNEPGSEGVIKLTPVLLRHRDE